MAKEKADKNDERTNVSGTDSGFGSEDGSVSEQKDDTKNNTKEKEAISDEEDDVQEQDYKEMEYLRMRTKRSYA